MKQNVTIRLDQETIQKAKMLAVRRSTSVSALLAKQIEVLVDDDDEEEYERAKKQALALLENEFHLGGVRVSRDDIA